MKSEDETKCSLESEDTAKVQNPMNPKDKFLYMMRNHKIQIPKKRKSGKPLKKKKDKKKKAKKKKAKKKKITNPLKKEKAKPLNNNG